MDSTPIRPADRKVVDATARYVLDNVTPLISKQNRQIAVLKGDLENAKSELTAATDHLQRLTADLNSRPTSDELEAAKARVDELLIRMGELEASIVQLEEKNRVLERENGELKDVVDNRPSEPDQLNEMIRRQLDPALEQLRKMVEA